MAITKDFINIIIDEYNRSIIVYNYVSSSFSFEEFNVYMVKGMVEICYHSDSFYIITDFRPKDLDDLRDKLYSFMLRGLLNEDS